MLKSFIDRQGILVLSKQQQKQVFGGLAAAAGGTCAAQSPSHGMIGIENVSKAQAQAYARANGTHWCCDSCSSASWYAGDI